jgi:hypothetical protein
LLSLTFTFSGLPVLVRAAFFRICADRTLRGPESSVVATFTPYGWTLGARSCREFEAAGPIFLRATCADGRRESLGPFEIIRAAEGALFTSGRCIGTYCLPPALGTSASGWKEVALLTDPGL